MYPVITIGRQYGSGGREIGKLVSELLGIRYYDKELLALAAKESGLDYHVADNFDEKPISSFLYSIVTGARSAGSDVYDSSSYLTLNDKLFIAQKSIMIRIAESPCVIVGRCADDVLSDMPNHISVYIYANKEFRARRVANEYGISLEKAADKITKTDKQRASFYKSNTGKKWGDPANYSLCIDSSKLSTKESARIIAEYVKSFISERENGV